MLNVLIIYFVDKRGHLFDLSSIFDLLTFVEIFDETNTDD